MNTVLTWIRNILMIVWIVSLDLNFSPNIWRPPFVWAWSNHDPTTQATKKNKSTKQWRWVASASSSNLMTKPASLPKERGKHKRKEPTHQKTKVEVQIRATREVSVYSQLYIAKGQLTWMLTRCQIKQHVKHYSIKKKATIGSPAK
jgi:hypothetical protein